MDLTYRTELRELNELNFARFDAKVGERLAELRSEMDLKLNDLRAEMTTRFAQAEVNLAQRLGDLKTSLIRWMFGFWLGTGAMVLGWFVTRWLTS